MGSRRIKTCVAMLSIIIAVSAPFMVSAIQNIFVKSSKVTDVKIGSVPINYVYKGSELVWSRPKDFMYTGGVQVFTVPYSGKYKVELWGAGAAQSWGGLGGYVSGFISLLKGEVLYIYVGEFGAGEINVARFNSSIARARTRAGGGATDVRLVNGAWNNSASLSSRIMVAGGGGMFVGAYNCGDGGGLVGGTGGGSSDPGTGGTQVGGGKSSASTSQAGRFGPGGFNTGTANDAYGGGGGGYWGGGANGAGMGCGGGGSSYISGHTGSVAITSVSDQTPKAGCTTSTSDNTCSIHYSGKKFTDTVMIDGAGYGWTRVKGGLQLMPKPEGGYYASGVGRKGDGYARITYFGE